MGTRRYAAAGLCWSVAVIGLQNYGVILHPFVLDRVIPNVPDVSDTNLRLHAITQSSDNADNGSALGNIH